MSDKQKALRLEWVEAMDLRDNPANWRTHPDLQREALDELLFGEEPVGWAGAALYNEATGRLIDGHLRREVAAVHDEPVPVLVGSGTGIVKGTGSPPPLCALPRTGVIKNQRSRLSAPGAFNQMTSSFS